jgi:hypothetical protein
MPLRLLAGKPNDAPEAPAAATAALPGDIEQAERRRHFTVTRQVRNSATGAVLIPNDYSEVG